MFATVYLSAKSLSGPGMILGVPSKHSRVLSFRELAVWRSPSAVVRKDKALECLPGTLYLSGGMGTEGMRERVS
jgi:hypothetical protein